MGEGSSPFSCRKYLWTVNPVFFKIYAHKWLCTTVCGHNIFLVTISWSEWGESNSRPRHPKCRALPTGLHPDFIKFFSKWSNMWSNGFPTKISVKRKSRDGVVWKDMCDKQLCKALRRFYAPKCRALPTGLHPDFYEIFFKVVKYVVKRISDQDFRETKSPWRCSVKRNVQQTALQSAPTVLCSQMKCDTNSASPDVYQNIIQ